MFNVCRLLCILFIFYFFFWLTGFCIVFDFLLVGGCCSFICVLNVLDFVLIVFDFFFEFVLYFRCTVLNLCIRVCFVCVCVFFFYIRVVCCLYVFVCFRVVFFCVCMFIFLLLLLVCSVCVYMLGLF